MNRTKQLRLAAGLTQIDAAALAGGEAADGDYEWNNGD